MKIKSDDIEFLVGSIDIVDNMSMTPVLPVFSERIVQFLSTLSQILLKDRRSKMYTDVLAYAYWIRKASLEQAKKKHIDKDNRIGRGVAFHLAPSNVPVNFAVSMTSSVLAGNCTLIRVSSKLFEQVQIICDNINQLLKNEFIDLQSYFCVVRYEHNEEITAQLSSICDIRVIWGGDRTIENIRKFKIPARAIEMTFADRYSIAIINADVYLKESYAEVAKGFYTDTYYTDQNACSSPRLIVWMGSRIEEAKNIFWSELDRLVKQQYHMQAIQAVDKYSSVCLLGMISGSIHLETKDNYIVRVEVERLTSNIMDYKESGGYFFEYSATDINEIKPVLTKKCQTISVLGIQKNQVKKLVFEAGVRGVDRIVPLGQTMGLEFIWDGFKMIESMSRFVYSGDYT